MPQRADKLGVLQKHHTYFRPTAVMSNCWSRLMNLSIRRFFYFFLICVVGALTLMGGGEASAQIFCPSTIPGQAGIALQGGTCTNGTTGAFSNAALASVALSDLSESTTQETTRTASGAIVERRQAEAERCPDGLERINGVCQRPAVTEPAPPPAPVAAPKPQASGAKKRAHQAQKKTVSPNLVYKAPPVPYVDTGVRTAAWIRVFGDYEHRTGLGQTAINCCQAGGGLLTPLALSASIILVPMGSSVAWISPAAICSRRAMA